MRARGAPDPPRLGLAPPAPYPPPCPLSPASLADPKKCLGEGDQTPYPGGAIQFLGMWTEVHCLEVVHFGLQGLWGFLVDLVRLQTYCWLRDLYLPRLVVFFLLVIFSPLVVQSRPFPC